MNISNPSLMLFCAFRYALGRRTYVVSVVVENIHRNWTELPESDRELFVREILEHKARFGKLGDSIDEREWDTIVERYNSETVRAS